MAIYGVAMDQNECLELRRKVIEAKAARNDALRENARDENDETRKRHSEADIAAMRLAVDVAALEARQAGCDIGDLVGPNVGEL
jgi:hypothetical protein